jgi:hypothetical protein
VKKPRNLAHPVGEIRWERFGVPSPNKIRAAQPWPAFSTAVFRMKTTKIQWCHSTVNPIMGCDGCELWKPAAAIQKRILEALVCDAGLPEAWLQKALVLAVGDRQTSEIYRDRELVAQTLAREAGLDKMPCEATVNIIHNECKCYAGLLGTLRAGHKGYADAFEEPKLFPGRVAKAAGWTVPGPNEISDKPWLAGLPRLIFISDIHGMSHGARGEEEIWHEFADDPETLAFESERLLAARLGQSIEQVADVDTDDLPPTGLEREATVRVHVNQNFFRDRILSAYNFRCCVTGLTVQPLLTARVKLFGKDEFGRSRARTGAGKLVAGGEQTEGVRLSRNLHPSGGNSEEPKNQ